MRNIISYESIKDNNDFWLYFIMTNFPESLDEITDKTCMEIIEENYTMNEEWINKFIKCYDGIFDESDGYVDNPNTLKIILATRDIFYIEFHAGDTIYYINDEEIGCTGPHYQIKKIDLEEYLNYTDMLDNKIKLLLLPMLKLEKSEEFNIYYILNDIIKEHNVLNLLVNSIFENIVI